MFYCTFVQPEKCEDLEQIRDYSLSSSPVEAVLCVGRIR